MCGGSVRRFLTSRCTLFQLLHHVRGEPYGCWRSLVGENLNRKRDAPNCDRPLPNMTIAGTADMKGQIGKRE